MQLPAAAARAYTLCYVERCFVADTTSAKAAAVAKCPARYVALLRIQLVLRLAHFCAEYKQYIEGITSRRRHVPGIEARY